MTRKKKSTDVRSPEQRAADVLSWFEQQGNGQYAGEAVSQTEHALQCAAKAELAGADEELLLAALLHDVGHLCAAGDAQRMGEYGVVEHEATGARYLQSVGFSARVADLVSGHVQAKRYLVAQQPRYAERLTPASQVTLQHQGGPMDASELKDFELDPDCQAKLDLRAWDEAAKQPGASTKTLKDYRPLIETHLQAQSIRMRAELSDADRNHWQRFGWVRIKGFLDVENTRRLAGWIDQLANWPETAGQWMKYFEQTADEPRQLCRVENFVPYHAPLAGLVAGRDTLALAGELFGEPACLFKEKVNFKLPGGGGFAPHQDAPAFRSFAENHITLMLAVDDATSANGCLEVAQHPGVGSVLPEADDLTIQKDCADALHWQPVPMRAGDLLAFDSSLPHRSSANNSSTARRALYLTYNPLAEGEHRDAYFRTKREQFPPEIEREAGRVYADGREFNVGNPIR